MGYLGLALLLLFGAPSLLTASISPANYSAVQANMSIANATAYVNMIANSTYLVFRPDLGQAYSYLNTSMLLEHSAPNESILYSEMAIGSARSAYAQIGAYRQVSAAVAIVFTVIVGVLLYRFMLPVKRRRNGRS